MGVEHKPLNIMLPMEVDYRRKKAKRQSWIPVVITEKGTVQPIEYHGSAHIASYSYANGMIAVPIGKMEVKKGELVHVRQI
ncbi:MAG: hypothetical protein C0594_09745 [Marinilabiliales bacterium]|nr:MAG: hypothetical protein C0594_09745 [Marinilabiliales bacterium]